MVKKNQVARNERERNRVHQVNHGFDILRERLQPKNHTKKWSKADTLRHAVKYIAHLQKQLSQEPPQPSVSPSTSSPDYSMNTNNFNSYAVKEEFSMYLPQSYHHGPPTQMTNPHGDNSQNFNSPTSSISSSSYSPTQMCYPPISYSNYPNH